MIKYSDLRGVIFDVDDTLLNNFSRDMNRRLHERVRWHAAQEVGKKYDIPELLKVDMQELIDAFETSPQHSLEGATWNTLYRAGLVKDQTIDHSHKLYKELLHLKLKLHPKVLQEEGEEIPGASKFVASLSENGPQGKLAIASTAARNEIYIFLDKFDLGQYFPDEHIISKEMVTHHKPHPEAFDLAFQRLGLPESARGNVLVFEDHPRGIAAAKAAGMPVFALTTSADRSDLAKLSTPPDVIADSFAEFAAILGLSGTMNI